MYKYIVTKSAIAYLNGKKCLLEEGDQISLESENFTDDPKAAFDYALNNCKGERCQKAEPIIMKDHFLAYVYARDVIKGRWEEAEPIIMKDPLSAYEYARDVIKGKWEEAEQFIKQEPSIYNMYLKMIGQNNGL